MEIRNDGEESSKYGKYCRTKKQAMFPTKPATVMDRGKSSNKRRPMKITVVP